MLLASLINLYDVSLDLLINVDLVEIPEEDGEG